MKSPHKVGERWMADLRGSAAAITTGGAGRPGGDRGSASNRASLAQRILAVGTLETQRSRVVRRGFEERQEGAAAETLSRLLGGKPLEVENPKGVAGLTPGTVGSGVSR